MNEYGPKTVGEFDTANQVNVEVSLDRHEKATDVDIRAFAGAVTTYLSLTPAEALELAHLLERGARDATAPRAGGA